MDSLQPWDDHDLRRAYLTELRERVGPYVLVGAHARDVICNDIAGLRMAMPSTSDLDIAIAIPRGTAYENAVASLDATGVDSRIRFHLPPDAPVPSPRAVPIDVLPYGSGVHDVENVAVGSGRVLDVSGLAEAASAALTVRVHPSLSVQVPPLHAMIGLKLIAYGLRSQWQEYKDARDLDLLLQAATAGDMAREDAWAHPDAVPEADYDASLTAAWVTGARMAALFDTALTRRAIDAGGRELPTRMVGYPYARALSAPGRDEVRELLKFLAMGAQSGAVVKPWPPMVP